MSNSCRNFAIVYDEQTRLGDSAWNEISASVDRNGTSFLPELQLEWNIVQLHNPTYSR